MRNAAPYKTGAITTAWDRIRERAGLKGGNLMARDLRSNALSDGPIGTNVSLFTSTIPRRSLTGTQLAAATPAGTATSVGAPSDFARAALLRSSR